MAVGGVAVWVVGVVGENGPGGGSLVCSLRVVARVVASVVAVGVVVKSVFAELFTAKVDNSLLPVARGGWSSPSRVAQGGIVSVKSVVVSVVVVSVVVLVVVATGGVFAVIIVSVVAIVGASAVVVSSLSGGRVSVVVVGAIVVTVVVTVVVAVVPGGAVVVVPSVRRSPPSSSSFVASRVAASVSLSAAWSAPSPVVCRATGAGVESPAADDCRVLCFVGLSLVPEMWRPKKVANEVLEPVRVAAGRTRLLSGASALFVQREWLAQEVHRRGGVARRQAQPVPRPSPVVQHVDCLEQSQQREWVSVVAAALSSSIAIAPTTLLEAEFSADSSWPLRRGLPGSNRDSPVAERWATGLFERRSV